MIKFLRIENGNIFTRDFRPFAKNNEICFSQEGIAVVYGPNGTGKTSLIKVLAGLENTKVEFEYESSLHTSSDKVFHVINDQNSRNIITGEAKDFLLGDDIRKEFELQEFISQERTKITNLIISTLKNYSIASTTNKLIPLIKEDDVGALVKDLANNKSKGGKYTTEKFIATLNTIATQDVPEYDEGKLTYFIKDYSSSDSIIEAVANLQTETLSSNPKVREIEENTEAIKILNRFHKEQCIVCDTDEIDRKLLLERKTQNRTSVIESLDEKTRTLIEKLITIMSEDDPFQIKECLMDALDTGDMSSLYSLNAEFEVYKKVVTKIILNNVCSIFSNSELSTKHAEYEALVERKPEISDEDLIYIEEIISGSMNKTLSIDRDDQKNLKIRLENQEFLHKGRDELPLSAGEQNFLSLAFEFLKAKNSNCPVVVIDDPVSSFDSIYKNKVVYAIVKILENKKRIVLTHNTDLLRLLESQYSSCYKMYILNNTDGEENGFIALKPREQEMLICLKKLLDTFRTEIFDYILDVNLFLISVIPFMRGYANIINSSGLFSQLTKLMHGYNTEKVNVSSVYKELFETDNAKIPDSYEISVDDILSKTVDGVHIVNNDEFPLLNKTLKHSFTYLFLRLMVEKNLVNKFNINTSQNKMLGQIISAAFPNNSDVTEIRKRIRLTSKKTLINEFNHFEGNLSIFQPAIDITDHALGNERTDINSFIASL